MSIDPFQLALGAAFGFASTGAIRWWQYRRDLWIGEIERFCDTLDAAAECAAEYWIREKLSASVGVNPTSDEIKAAIEVSLYEARLLGFQNRLDGMLYSISSRLPESDKLRLEMNMAGFSDALTGGSYGSASRTADPNRVQLAQVNASDMLVELRRSLAKALSLSGTASHYFRAFRERYAETRIND
ncbi:hypothetical protein [Methylobacterium sp. Leaf88]|uniref:hypothetical protein n=1 Tax=Methylobacterium sp. Leaf88 TaxID=1736244 RepID=UPI000AA2D9EA|nr:hypothetical protein [Methylobacterium sp. Leaf88]